MIKNYLNVAYRNLLKSKVFSLVNILGLTIGMAACLVIVQYINFEFSYDTFHKNADQIYRVVADYSEKASNNTTLTPPPLGPILQEDFAEVVNFTRMILPWSGPSSSSTLSWMKSDQELVKQSFRRGFFVDPGFTTMFSMNLIRGNPQTVLDGPNKIVLSEGAVRKIFGEDWQDLPQLIGQTLEYTNDYDRLELMISGIVEDGPDNSHFRYDFLASFSTLSTGWGKDYAETWEGNGVYTYLQLSPLAHTDEFRTKALASFAAHAPEDIPRIENFVLQPLTDIHLYSHRGDEIEVNGNPMHTYFLAVLAGLILLVAIVNYVNMTMAKAVTRSQEIGIRKLMGAQRKQLVSQFFLESLLHNIISMGLAITLLQALHPWYAQITGKVLHFDQIYFWKVSFLLFVISTFLAALFPVIKLSYPSPSLLLQGKGNIRPRRSAIQGMVISQFWASVVLILFTFAVVSQLHFMQNYELGFNQEGVIVVKGPENRNQTWIEHEQQKRNTPPEDVFKNTIGAYIGVKAVSFSRTTPGEQSSIYAIRLGKAHQQARIQVLKSDDDYAAVYDLKLLAGRFDTGRGSVISQNTAELLGYAVPDDAIGRTFRDEYEQEYLIAGVVEDYYHQSLQHTPQPFLFTRDDLSYQLDSFYNIKVAEKDLNQTMEQIEKIYAKVFPYETFEYYFIDEYFNAQYQEDLRFGQLFGLFSSLTIFVACMGLFGLTLHTITERTQEIGIRKVLGASVVSIVKLLSWKFIRLVMIACLLALPVGYWVIQQWLDGYAVRTEISGWLMLLPVGIVLTIAFLTVSFQTIRAALANPTDSLRYE